MGDLAVITALNHSGSFGEISLSLRNKILCLFLLTFVNSATVVEKSLIIAAESQVFTDFFKK